jgi:hypothetical protein
MSETERELRDRLARLQAMLDQLDRDAERMRQTERLVRRQQRLQCYGSIRH